MSLFHCPLCIALAVVSAARGLSLAALLWQLRAVGRCPGQARAGSHRAGILWAQG
ncbi:hypothetical protein H6G65_05385 [Microcystis elabens FACHB-917]|nr:hypothetical protein [Microcystis elabens FACHB-917]